MGREDEPRVVRRIEQTVERAGEVAAAAGHPNWIIAWGFGLAVAIVVLAVTVPMPWPAWLNWLVLGVVVAAFLFLMVHLVVLTVRQQIANYREAMAPFTRCPNCARWVEAAGECVCGELLPLPE